jgi:hypothetical protein
MDTLQSVFFDIVMYLFSDYLIAGRAVALSRDGNPASSRPGERFLLTYKRNLRRRF